MTPEMIQTAITTVAEEAVKASMKGSLAAAMMGHAAAIGGLAAGLPTADATEAIDQVIGMLTEARDTIGDMNGASSEHDEGAPPARWGALRLWGRQRGASVSAR